MFGLTSLGAVHTAISRVALAAGVTSFFFHLIPGATETFTRLPAGAPLFSGPDDPALQKVVGVLFLLFLLGAGWQVRQLWAAPASAADMRAGRLS